MTSKRKAEIMHTIKSFDGLAAIKAKITAAPIEGPVNPVEPAPFRSGSNRVKDYFASLQGDTISVTAEELSQRVGVTVGSASGFLSRLIKSGAAHYGEGRSGKMTYVVDLKSCAEMVTKNMRARGSIPGNQKNVETRHFAPRVRTEPLPLVSATEFASIPAALYHYAKLLEGYRVPLSVYSDDELIEELRVRVRHRSA